MRRHGQRPLAILGRALVWGDNRCAGLPWWSSITVHETSAARLAVALRHGGVEGGDFSGAGPAWHDAELHESAASLRDALARHDPLRAFPVGVMDSARSGFLTPPDGLAAWRFRLAWAGLLGALFGLRPAEAPEGVSGGQPGGSPA